MGSIPVGGAKIPDALHSEFFHFRIADLFFLP